MRLVGANPNAPVEGFDRLPGISNYFIGNDPKKWQTNVPHYAKVHSREVYPGIDLVYYGTCGQLEYDVVVAPGSSPSLFRLVPEGVDRFYIDQNGNLVLITNGVRIQQPKPFVYQQIAGPDRR